MKTIDVTEQDFQNFKMSGTNPLSSWKMYVSFIILATRISANYLIYRKLNDIVGVCYKYINY